MRSSSYPIVVVAEQVVVVFLFVSYVWMFVGIFEVSTFCITGEALLLINWLANKLIEKLHHESNNIELFLYVNDVEKMLYSFQPVLVSGP